MSYTPPVYPTAIPSYTTDGDDLPPWYDDLDFWNAEKANALRLELCAALSELGTLPKGNFTTVKDRIDYINLAAALKLTTAYALAGESNNIIPWSYTNSTETVKEETIHSMTTNPERFYAPRDGLYSINIQIWIYSALLEGFYLEGVIMDQEDEPLFYPASISPGAHTYVLLANLMWNATAGSYIRTSLYIEEATDAILVPGYNNINITFLR